MGMIYSEFFLFLKPYALRLWPFHLSLRSLRLCGEYTIFTEQQTGVCDILLKLAQLITDIVYIKARWSGASEPKKELKGLAPRYRL